jgi:hypothetical protein
MIDASYTSTAAAQHGTVLEEDPTALPTAAAPPVDQALLSVQDSLAQVAGGAVGKVFDIAPTVAALSPADRNNLVSRLSDQELHLWLEAAGQHTNPEDQQQTFDALAQGLDDKQLGRVIAALDTDTAVNSDNAGVVGRLGDAIVAHKSAAELQQFVQSSAGQVEGDQKTALIVAKALDALGAQALPSTYAGGIPYTPPNHFEPAVAALSDTQLNSVVEAAAQETVEGNARVVDPSVLVALLDTASTAPLGSEQTQRLIESGLGVVQRVVERPDEGPRAAEVNAQLVGSLTKLIGSEHGASIEQRAELFEATANTWGEFAGGNAETDAAIATALKDLLATDTNGVLGELEAQHGEGKGVTTFVRELIAQGRADELKPIVTQLQRGNDLTGDTITRYTSGDGEQHKHAQVLGYFVGAIYAGTSQLDKNKDDQAGVLGDVFDVAAWVPGVDGKVLDMAKFAATKAFENDIDTYKKSNDDLRTSLHSLAYPTDADGRRLDDVDFELPYKTNVDWVINHNKG